MAGLIGRFLRSWLTSRSSSPRVLQPQRARGIPVPAAVQEQVRDLMLRGSILQAVKEVRTAIGCDLRDGKDVAYALLYGVEVPTTVVLDKPRP